MSGLIQKPHKNGHFKIQDFLMYLCAVARNNLGDDYHIMSDLVLKAPGGTTQTDQVIISRYAIFVVEIKAYKGSNQNKSEKHGKLPNGYSFIHKCSVNIKHYFPQQPC